MTALEPHAAQTLFSFLQNAVYIIMLPFSNNTFFINQTLKFRYQLWV